MDDTTLKSYTLAERKDTYQKLLKAQKLTQFGRVTGIKNIHNDKNGVPPERMPIALKTLEGIEITEQDIKEFKELSQLYKKARFALKPAVSNESIKSELPEPAEASGNAEIFDPEITYLENMYEPANMQRTVLSRAMEDIRTGAYKVQVGNARRLYGVNSEAYTKNKERLPAYAFAGLFEGKVANDNFVKSSDIILVDIDKLGDNLVPVDEKLRAIDCCLFSFVSPSDDGLKAGFRLEPGTIKNDADNKMVFMAIEARLKSEGIEITVDKACKDVRRLCYVSYDTELYFNREAKCFDVEAWLPKPKTLNPKQGTGTASNTNQLSKITMALMGDTKQDCTGKLENMLRGAKQGDRHEARRRVGMLAGGYIEKGLLTEEEALEVLKRTSDAISDNKVTDDKQWRTILSAIEIGKGLPLVEDTPKTSLFANNSVAGVAPTFECTRLGLIVATLRNIRKALEYAERFGWYIGYDAFKDDVMFHKGDGQWQPFQDHHYTNLREDLPSLGFEELKKELVRDAVIAHAQRNRFDSAQQWLDGLVWDGTPRVEMCCINYFGAKDSEYTRAVGFYMCSAMAGRVLQPGCQADMVPVLVSPQGRLKSTAIAALVPSQELFCEISFHSKDADNARLMRGTLIAEIAELSGLRKRDVESVRPFLTRRFEVWTPKYKEFTNTFPRRLIFIGTSNTREILCDDEGERRWLPFDITKTDREAIARDRDQLWAEAAVLFRANGVMWEAAERLAKDVHQDFKVMDIWHSDVEDYLSRRPAIITELQQNCTALGNRPSLQADKLARLLKGITSAELLEDVVKLPIDRRDHAAKIRIASIMKALGYKSIRPMVSGSYFPHWVTC